MSSGNRAKIGAGMNKPTGVQLSPLLDRRNSDPRLGEEELDNRTVVCCFKVGQRSVCNGCVRP